LAWRLILLFIPGILCTAIIDTLVVHKPWPAFEFLIRPFIFGILTYFTLQSLFLLIDYISSLIQKAAFVPSYLSIWDSLTNKQTPIKFTEILYSSITSILVALVASKAINDKWIIKLGQKSRVTKKFGDDDVWSYFLNSKDVEWVWVRFPERDIVYEGWVQSLSDSEGLRELVLQEVKVFSNSTSQLLYELPAAYLSGPPSQFIVELPPSTENPVEAIITRPSSTTKHSVKQKKGAT